MKQSQRPLSRSKRNIQCGLPIDSLTLVAFGNGMNSDHSNDSTDDCDENLHPRSSNMLLANEPCDVIKVDNNTVWACSTLLTGLSLNKSRNTVQSSLAATKLHTASRAQVDKKQLRGSHTIAKKSNESIPLILNNGLSSFLCNNASDADSENEMHYHQRFGMKKNSNKTSKERKNRAAASTSNNLKCRTRNQRNEIFSKYNYKEDHTIARQQQQKHIKGTNKDRMNPSKRMLTQQESDLFLAVTQKEHSKPMNNNDFDSNASLSSHSIQGNLLSLFQSQMVVSRQNRKNSIFPSSSNNDQLPAGKAAKSKKRSKIATILRTSISDYNNNSKNDNVKNHHLPSPFASPQPTESRRHNKRRDRKNTPNIKSGIVHCCLKKGSNNAALDAKDKPEQGHDPALAVENIETMPFYEDDTTSSLSDDSLSGVWNGTNENQAENSVHPALESSIQLETACAVDVCLDVKRKESTMYFSSDTDDNIRNGKRLVVDGIDKNDDNPLNQRTTTSSIGFERSNQGNDDVPTATNLELCYPDEQPVQGSTPSKMLTDSLEVTHNDIDTTEKEQETISEIIGSIDYSLNDSKHNDPMNISKIHEDETGGVRRSNRARTITNRFTVTESGKTSSNSHVHPILQLKEQRKSTRHGTDSNSYMPKLVKTSKSKANAAKTIHNEESKAVPLETTKVDRPRRDRKRTDFYYNHFSVAEENIDGNKPDAIGIVLSPTAVLNSIENDQESHRLEPTATVNTKNTRGILTTKVLQGKSDSRGSKSETESLSIADCDKWSIEQVQQLEDAQEQVDPTSATYWIDVSNMVQGKSALECQTQWLATAKTPLPKTKNVRSKLPSKIDDVLQEEDDIFQSTPMRYNANSDSIYEGTFDPIMMPKLPTSAVKSTEIVDEESDLAHSFTMFNMKPIPKTFLQRMKRDFTREKQSQVTTKTSQGQIQTKNPAIKTFTEVLRDDDIDINIRLTPGGTLKVKSQLNEEDDDFWDDEYDADEENENMIGPFY